MSEISDLSSTQLSD